MKRDAAYWKRELLQAQQILLSPNCSQDRREILEGHIVECEWMLKELKEAEPDR